MWCTDACVVLQDELLRYSISVTRMTDRSDRSRDMPMPLDVGFEHNDLDLEIPQVRTIGTVARWARSRDPRGRAYRRSVLRVVLVLGLLFVTVVVLSAVL